MSLLLAISRVYLPMPIRRSRLDELFRATADAFQHPSQPLGDYPLDHCLLKYALFTSENARAVMGTAGEAGVKARLFSNACRIGGDIRKELGIHSLAEAMQAFEVIYRALNIELHGDLQGQICIPNCFFSAFYSAGVCRIISSLDEGLVAGLFGGFKLEFSQRITAGASCCRARLVGPGGRQ